VLVATDLSDLRGPTTGTIELPLRLFWQEDRTFDLDDPGMFRWMYENVLREAVYATELTAYLNGEALIAVWPELFLPKDVRLAWESRHPILRRQSGRAQ
jgi:hypothetical protein